jgi:superfamily II DNA/RNA helicase
LAEYLKEFGFEVDLIHGGRSQGQRNRAIDNFKKGRVRILCATDVAARGIDIPKVEHVINFDLPMMDEDYVHRIGRTGRNGASGQAVSFVSPDEMHTWRMLVKKFKIEGADLGFGSNLDSKHIGGKKSFRKKSFSKKSRDSRVSSGKRNQYT